MRQVLGLVLLLTGLHAVTASPGAALQQPATEEAELPPEVADGIVDFFNDPLTIRFNGRSALPEGRTIAGDVGVLGGPFLVAGTLEGSLIVVNGDLTVAEGGRVSGDVVVVGGRVRELPEGAVQGSVTVYAQRLAYDARGGTVQLRGGPRTERRGIYLGDSRITVRAGTNYNRVEGLPVLFGPVFRSSGSNPLLLEALGILRTENGSTRDDVGYQVRLEQRFGVPARVTVGGSAFSQVTPIEAWGLRDLEASLATFFLHRDFRDYWERQGFSLFVGAPIAGAPVEVTAEFRSEEHRSVPVASPWTLRRKDEPWRPQPLVAEGDVQTLGLTATIDRRNDPDDPSDGWMASARVVRGIGGEWFRPRHFDPLTGEPVAAVPIPSGFTSGFLDLRRYARVGPDADLAFRALLAGSLDGDPMPPQYQHALGGEGSLPGYSQLSLDCGARSSSVLVERGDDDAPFLDPAFVRYGCDRIALFQLEYRGRFSLDLGLGPDQEDWEDWDWYPAVDLSPSWAAFLSVGRGWSLVDGEPDVARAADVGLGLYLGDLGLYAAYPLDGRGRDLNFFIRLQRRF